MTPTPDSAAQGGVTQARPKLGLCDVCRKPLAAHDTGAGIPICHGIYAPGYRSTLNDALVASAPPAQQVGVEDALWEALRAMVYETTHLSPMKPNGDHDCTIRSATLERARAALRPSTDAAAQPTDAGVGE